MDELLNWLTQYSPPVVLVIGFCAAILFVTKKIVEKSVDTAFDQKLKSLELNLERRSEFEAAVLMERYTVVKDLSRRLEQMRTDINRHRNWQSMQEILQNNEFVPLTKVYEDLEIHRLVLGETFFSLFHAQAKLTLKFLNIKNATAEASILAELTENKTSVRAAAEAAFKLSDISW